MSKKLQSVFIGNISGIPDSNNTFWIKEGTSYYKNIIMNDIVFVESKNKICEINMIDGTIFKKRATLEKEVYEQILSSYNNFYKLNRSFILNLDHINTIEGRRIVYSNLRNIKIRIPDDQIKELFDLIGLKK